MNKCLLGLLLVVGSCSASEVVVEKPVEHFLFEYFGFNPLMGNIVKDVQYLITKKIISGVDEKLTLEQVLYINFVVKLVEKRLPYQIGIIWLYGGLERAYYERLYVHFGKIFLNLSDERQRYLISRWIGPWRVN